MNSVDHAESQAGFGAHQAIIATLLLAFVWALSGLSGVLVPLRNVTLVSTTADYGSFEKALGALTPGDLEQLQRREASALAQEPLDLFALQNLGVIAGLQGDLPLQKALAQHLPKFSKRNTAALLTAINIYLDDRQYAEALSLMDPLLRAQPQAQSLVFPQLSVLLQQRVGIVELAQLLKKQPPWRQDFFIYLSQTKNLPDVVHDFLLALRKNGVALQSAELRVTLNALLRQSFADRAYFVWLNTLSRDDLNVAGRVYDGEFTRVSDNQFFDWTILKRPTARIGVVPRPGDAADNMLSLKFYNDVGLFRHVQQYVRLQPGRFQLSFEQMASDLQTEAGLFWAIRCLKSKSLLGNSKALKTSGPWIASNFAFEVPAQNCDTQVLSLESATRSTLDMKVNGQIAYDRFVISPY